ncbi:MAG: hypothetical protein ACPGIA_08965 [Luteolibacter sp.]
MKQKYLFLAVIALSAALIACGEKKSSDDHDHSQCGGCDHSDEDQGHGEKTDLGSFMIGDLEVTATQAHGTVAGGKEGHLVVKLPHKDDGATIIRAWIGTEDRTLSQVGKGVYAASSDDYDIHTMAPSTLPEDVKWWVEVEKTDGTKVVGSIAPKM